MTATIRKATLPDLAPLVDLFEGYRNFYQCEPRPRDAKQFLAERLTNKDSEIFIAVTGAGILTGFVQLYPLFSSTRMRRMWLLNDLFVLPEHRGQGISKKLIAEAKQLCHRTGACGLMLETAKSNVTGNQLYPATGFTLDSEHNYYFWNKP